jgi:NAD+ synthetase
VAIAAVNQVGGNDELVFAGAATVHVPAPAGESPRLVRAGPAFKEELVLFDLPDRREQWQSLESVPDPLEAGEEHLLWSALTLGVRDYCAKTGFKGAVLGLSGGVDSSVTACLAAAALGPENVLGVSMPSRFSSPGSISDARRLAESLAMKLVTEPIEGPHAAFERLLTSAYEGLAADPRPGVAEENLQSRIRGTLLMAFSNKLGLLLLTTGNKSELGVGYCTLYGDMNGGLAAISDLTKAQVYRLARWINANHARCGFGAPPIPDAVLTKPPSAELRPDQTDQDTLPPYDQVDEIIDRYVGRRQSAARIAAEAGIPRDVVSRVIRLVDVSEFKRRQTPVGLKVTDVAFGAGRRMPIAQGWRADREEG